MISTTRRHCFCLLGGSAAVGVPSRHSVGIVGQTNGTSNGVNTYAPKSQARIDKVSQYNTYKDRSKLKLIITKFLTFYIINMNFERDFSHVS